MMMTMASVAPMASVGVAVSSLRLAVPRLRTASARVVLVRVTTVVVLVPSSRHRRTLAWITAPREPRPRTGGRAAQQPSGRKTSMNSRFSARP